MKKKLTYLLTFVLCFTMLAPNVKAAVQPTLTLTNTTGDNVVVAVTGDASSNIRLSFLPSGASSVTSIIFGTTDANGNFSTSISSGGYGIPQGSPVYVVINGMQSSTTLWPSYASSLILSKTNVNIGIGQGITVTGSNTLILAGNSMNAIIGVVLTGSQVTITGLSNGSGVLSLCSANVGCGSISVVVGGQGISQISFSQNNFTLNDSQAKNIDIYGGSNAGFTITSNSNPNAVEASISGTSNIISLYGKHTPGSATIIVCSKESSSNCANLTVTTLSSTVNNLSFSQNNITLNPGLSVNIVVSGGPDNNYYISANSNSGVVGATISATVLTLVGGSNAGSSVISVCSATTNATCSNLNVTLNLNNTPASATSLSFSQNVVSVPKNETTNVTVTGGSGTGYAISSNSNPGIASANIVGNTNIIAIQGTEIGSSIISVCSAVGGSTCASIFVSVTAELLPITFSQNNISLNSTVKTVVIINGGSGTGKVISSNSNPAAVSAELNNSGTVLTIGGGTVSGNSAITICSATYSTNCSILNVTYIAPTPASTGTATDQNSTTPSSGTITTPASSHDQIEKINTEASDVFKKNNITKDTTLENKTTTSYTNILVSGNTPVSKDTTESITNFIAYGTPTTKNIGAGERAGVLGSYQKAFNKLPATANEWTDVIKIANGRWPGEASSAAIESAKVEFKKVYKRDANLSNQNDNAAISIIAYGLRPTARNTTSESFSIKTFKAVYGHNPVSSLAWDIVRAIAYSGAKR